MNILGIGNTCKDYREKILELSLADFCKKMNCNYKKIWAWEHGKSTNINNISYYWYADEQQAHREMLCMGIFENL